MISELYHHGIKGQKWGVRRYRNSDGSLTLAGQIRYDSMSGKSYIKRLKKKFVIKDQSYMENPIDG